VKRWSLNARNKGPSDHSLEKKNRSVWNQGTAFQEETVMKTMREEIYYLSSRKSKEKRVPVSHVILENSGWAGLRT
jgi:hypothetical protein